MNSMKNHSIMKVIRSYDGIAPQFVVCIYNPVHTTTELFEDGAQKSQNPVAFTWHRIDIVWKRHFNRSYLCEMKTEPLPVPYEHSSRYSFPAF